MFDLRYHVASLAAVFIALIIGILVGVGISGSGFVESRERELLNRQIEDLRADRDRKQEQIDDLKDAQRSAQAFVERTYPAVMTNRLRGRRIAVLFVGGVDPRTVGGIDQALADAGADTAVRMRALQVPINVDAVDAVLSQQPAFLPYVGDDKLDELGDALGGEFVRGGETPLWRSLATQLVAEQEGTSTRPADGVVVVRSAGPQSGETARFVNGLYAGLASAGIPAVGVETIPAQPSAIGVFRRAGLASVDDVDTAPGRLALVLLLAGAPRGHYGLKTTATDGVLPPMEPALVTTPVTGG